MWLSRTAEPYQGALGLSASGPGLIPARRRALGVEHFPQSARSVRRPAAVQRELPPTEHVPPCYPGETQPLPEPGSAFLRCCSASTPAGVTEATAVCSLFFQPLTTSPSPLIMASKPVLATSAGSSFSDWPTFVSVMPARSKNSVSVGPGIRHVTVAPVSFSSFRSAKEKESMKALVAL